jgi:hypothetical protein
MPKPYYLPDADGCGVRLNKLTAKSTAIFFQA